MRPIATNGVAWSVCVSVSLLVMFVNPAKTAESSRYSFWERTRVGIRNHVSDEGADLLTGKGAFEGGHVPARSNLPTHGECSCPLHTVNKCIRRRES